MHQVVVFDHTNYPIDLRFVLGPEWSPKNLQQILALVFWLPQKLEYTRSKKWSRTA